MPVNNKNDYSIDTSMMLPVAYPVKSSNAPLVPNVMAKVQVPSMPVKGWHERAITYLNTIDSKLDEVPNLPIQDKLDAIGNLIEAKFAKLDKFNKWLDDNENKWLDDNENGAWYKQLALFLVKLPMRAVRNIIKLLYNIIKGIVYTTIHPLKAVNQLAKMLVNLAHELTKPETWSKMGVGMIGASLGTAVTSGNPISVVGIGIGAAMLLAGLTVGSVKAALANKGYEFDAVLDHLVEQGKELPEAMLTGFLLGLMMGGIQRAAQTSEKNAFKVTDDKSAKEWVDKYAARENLPEADFVRYHSGTEIEMGWNNDKFMELFKNKPSLFFGRVSDYMSSQWASGTFNPAAGHHYDLFQNVAVTNGTPFLANTVVLKA